jgi:hypothetical protein
MGDAMIALADNPVAQSFLACLARARHTTQPFDYWLLKEALPEQDIDGLLALPSQPLPTRPSTAGASNNAQRMFFGREAQERFAVCRRVVDGFRTARHRHHRAHDRRSSRERG